MKIKAHILSVEDSGDKLSLTLQGQADGAADHSFRPWMKLSVEVPMSTRSQRAYHVGREVNITINPR